MPQATINQHIVFFEDDDNPSNPLRKTVDWTRVASDLPFEQVYSERFLLREGVTRVLDAGVGIVNLAADPQALVAGVGKPTWYHFVGNAASSSWAAALSTGALGITLTPSASDLRVAVMNGPALVDMSGVLPGDWVYLAGSQYGGDSGVFSAPNQGFWEVVAVTPTALTMRRIYPDDSSVLETVTSTSAWDVQRIADATRPRFLLAQGVPTFSGMYKVVGATHNWLAVEAPSQFVPATGVTFDVLEAAFTFIGYIRVESDMPVMLAIGDTGGGVNDITLIQVVKGTPVWYEAFTYATSFSVLNNGGQGSATVNIIYAYSDRFHCHEHHHCHGRE